MHENIEKKNVEYLDETFHKKKLSMGLAMQIISIDQTVRRSTVQDLNYFNSQPLTTQDKNGEQLVSLIYAIRKTFDLMKNDIFEFSTENETLKNYLGEDDEK